MDFRVPSAESDATREYSKQRGDRPPRSPLPCSNSYQELTYQSDPVDWRKRCITTLLLVKFETRHHWRNDAQ
jgi:hypothetical protein